MVTPVAPVESLKVMTVPSAEMAPGDGEGYAEHGAVGLFGLRGEIVDRRTHPLVVGVGVGIGERAREGGDGAAPAGRWRIGAGCCGAW